MLKAILIFLAGVTLGAVGCVGTAYFVFVHQANLIADTPIELTERPRNAARDDAEECPPHGPDILVGTWEGEKYFPNRGTTQIWRAERFADGTFVLEFFDEDSPGTVEVTETGYWGYSRCLYTTIIRILNGNPVDFQEVYRVHHVDDSIMRYTNFRSGRTYELRRVQ